MDEHPHTRTAARLYALLDSPHIHNRRAHDRVPTRPTPAAHSPAPLDLGLIDYLADKSARLADFAARNCVYGPIPGRPKNDADLYEWAARVVPADRQPILDAIAWRDAAEHALRLADDQTMIRQQACPQCGCWGLVWDSETRLVICGQTECVQDHGLPTAYSLSELARHVVRSRNRRRTGTA